mmetsp:Transcript_26358/g.38928  ORF Transcript_26358/g.38928 Transcript_26358/m.38928 type:complete len:239 (+) Transcript_26358:35-751(+)
MMTTKSMYCPCRIFGAVLRLLLLLSIMELGFSFRTSPSWRCNHFWQTLTDGCKPAIIGVAFLAITLNCEPSIASTGYEGEKLNACHEKSNCVSSNYKEPPNRYFSPLKIVNDPGEAYRRAIRDIGNEGITIVEANSKDHYIHLTVPGTAPSSLDDVELLVSNAGIINVRCEARTTLPPPPFCLKRNCINGNMDQRERILKVARVLGLPLDDEMQMKNEAKWTPIFFNSDRVPGIEEDE